MRQIDKIDVLGVGIDGREIVNRLFLEHLLTDVYYIHCMKFEQSNEIYIPFPGTVRYVYGEKHDIYEVDRIDCDKLKEIYKKFHSKTIIIMSLAEPISQFILEDLMDSTYKIIIRFPSKFENTHHYERANNLLKRIIQRLNTFIIDSEIYARAVKTVPFSGIKHQLLCAQATYIATLLGYLSAGDELARLPLNYLCRDRVSFVFDPDYIDFDSKTFKQSIKTFLGLILDDSLKILKIESSAYSRGYIHFIKYESTLELLFFSMILLYFNKKIENKASYMIWGREAYDLHVLLENGYDLEIPEPLQVLSEGFHYLKSKLADSDVEKISGNRLTILMSQYILEVKTTFLSKAFLTALSIV